MQKARLADPFLFVDDDAVHHRDLPRRTAEGERGDTEPHPERLGKRDAVRVLGPAGRIGDRGLTHYFSFQALAAGVQLWVSP